MRPAFAARQRPEARLILQSSTSCEERTGYHNHPPSAAGPSAAARRPGRPSCDSASTCAVVLLHEDARRAVGIVARQRIRHTVAEALVQVLRALVVGAHGQADAAGTQRGLTAFEQAPGHALPAKPR